MDIVYLDEMNSLFQICFYLLILLLCACNDDPVADVIFYNGDVVTMSGENGVHQSLGIKDGEILYVGNQEDQERFQSVRTQLIDLKGRTLLPGFIDAHSHFSLAMQTLNWANLSSPPVSDIKSINDILVRLEGHRQERNLDPAEWLIGWGYDPDLIEERRHPNKLDLDEAFPDQPVFLAHASGHLGVVNSAALRVIGWSAETADPQGGQIIRFDNSKEPSGLITESAMHAVREAIPQPDSEDMTRLAAEAFDLYARNGITTVNDGFSTAENIDLLEQLSTSIDFPLDIISLLGFVDLAKIMSQHDIKFHQYNRRLKYAGVKIVADGSPQGKTALMSDPYLTEVPGCTHDCKGIAVVQQAQLDQLLDKLYGDGVQVYTHCNGDAAIDMYLNAHDQAVDKHNLTSSDLRSVIIHSQFMRPDLIEQYAHYGLIPSYFTNHTYYWGDVHVRNLGMERAAYISPLVSSEESGVTYTNHTDYPITALDQSFLLWSAVNRVSRSGQVLGSDQRSKVYDALEAMTIHAAYQYREEDRKGSLEPGKLGDLVILSDNPLDIDPMKLKDIEVLATYKEGQEVYAKTEE
jgi:predicted amidohydrolase YtcJ